MRFFTTIVSIILVYGINNAFALSVTCLPSGTSCSSCTSYKCDSGYYGTATSASAGCTKCPSNATCAGGNDSTFLCDEGYYKSSTSCIACPSNASCSGGNTSTFTCNKGYYKSGSTCTRCPSETNYDGTQIYGTTNNPNASSMTDCYMPENTPITDWTGTYEFTGRCYYSNQITPL